MSEEACYTIECGDIIPKDEWFEITEKERSEASSDHGSREVKEPEIIEEIIEVDDETRRFNTLQKIIMSDKLGGIKEVNHYWLIRDSIYKLRELYPIRRYRHNYRNDNYPRVQDSYPFSCLRKSADPLLYNHRLDLKAEKELDRRYIIEN